MNDCLRTYIILKSFPCEIFRPPRGFEPTTFLISIKLEYELSFENLMPKKLEKKKNLMFTLRYDPTTLNMLIQLI